MISPRRKVRACRLGGFLVFFVLGLALGVSFGFGYARSLLPPEAHDEAARPAAPSETHATEASSTEENAPNIPDISSLDVGLLLQEHALGEDENGLFIAGTLRNETEYPYNAVKVVFDLCDTTSEAYSYVTDGPEYGMESGDSWSFCIYIPYTDLVRFSSYRVRSILGVRR